ncbi:hypothetical protein SLEP1_g48879 [Rubroshorea leprosula]|uniref:Uncharacterized protein n=1 Tax=Rubroshorea leprosula TaxID=152421 RepID=A0AAV5LV26_9ROSI|nr:hypothetical protein SLEP1_g48879 [Rubroshorea leprosula]
MYRIWKCKAPIKGICILDRYKNRMHTQYFPHTKLELILHVLIKFLLRKGTLY